jgi:hypothetical protein
MKNWSLERLTATSLLLTASLLASEARVSAAPAVQAWVQRYNGPANGTDCAYAIAVDQTNGNVYVTGYAMVTNYFHAYATIAYSSHGTRLWTNYYIGPAHSDSATAIAVDPSSGNVYVTGWSETASGSDFATVAYASAGTPLWTNRYHHPIWLNACAYAVAVGLSGNLYVGGSVNNSKQGTYATVAYSSVGTPLWTNFYRGTAAAGAFFSTMAVDGHGNVYVTGTSHESGGASEFATVAYSGTGTPLWTNCYVSAISYGNGPRMGIAVDNSDNQVYVAGYSENAKSGLDYTIVAYSSVGIALWTNRYYIANDTSERATALAVGKSGDVYGTGGSDVDWATTAYSSSGARLWTNRCGGSGQAVAAGANGDVIVAGTFWGHPANYLTIAYSASGALLWTNLYIGPLGGKDYHPGTSYLAIGPDGGIYVTGASQAVHDGITNYDYATIKYLPAPDIRFTGLDPLPEATWRLTLTAPTDVGVRLEASSNLVGWLTLTNYTNLPFTSIQYTDTLAPGCSTRFYRAVWVP